MALLYIDNSALIARLDADDDDLRSKERGSEIQVGNHVSLGYNFRGILEERMFFGIVHSLDTN